MHHSLPFLSKTGRTKHIVENISWGKQTKNHAYIDGALRWINRNLSTDYPRLARNGVLYPHLPVALVASMVDSGDSGLPRKRKEAERRAEPSLATHFSDCALLSHLHRCFPRPLHYQCDRKGRSWHNSKLSSPSPGYVGANPTQFNKDGMPHASSFRMASTRRYFDNRTAMEGSSHHMDHGESVPEPIREHLPISEERRAGYRDGRARHGNVGRSERQTAVTHSAGSQRRRA